MNIITIDGMVEHDFRHSVEDMLRLDQVDEAVERLQALIAPYCGTNGILPPCFSSASRRPVEIGGWGRLADRLADHDRPQRPITGIGVTLADATRLGGAGPTRGRLAPFIKTYYFSDEAYPFSSATRDDLLDGYSRDGFEWQGDYQATDVTLSVRGLDDLHGPIVTLEQQLLARPEPDEEEIRAGTIGACLVAVLIHRALRDTISSQGLPRPLCVIAACDGVYPLFDAPVAGVEASGGVPADEEADDAEDGAVASGSLLNLIARSRDKTMALALSIEDADEGHRLEELAEAQSIDATGEHAPAGSLDLSQFGSGRACDDPEDRDDHGEYEHRPPPAGWAPPMPPARELQSLPVDFGLALSEPDDEVDWQDDREALDPPPDLAAFADSPSDLPEDDAQIDEGAPAEASEPLAPPLGHSLRARIVVTPVNEGRKVHGPLGAFIAWVRRMVLRR